MARIIHFDILARDVQRAIRFYEAAFGWTITKWDGPLDYWLVGTGADSEPGIDGGLSQGEPNFTNGDLTLGVDSLEDVVAKVKLSGGRVATDRHPVQGVGWMATVEDTEGNRFGLMQEDASAR